MQVTYGKGCIERQRLENESDGTGYGCWPKGGRLSRWLRLWTESLIPLETGWPTFAEAGAQGLVFEQTGGSPPS